MFCAAGLVFGGTEGVGSRFHVLRSQTRFRRYRGRPVPFSCFARPDSCSTVPRASCLVFSCFVLPNSFSTVPSASGSVIMFGAPGHVFGGTEGVGSCFHVLCSRTHFRRYRGRCPIFMFCAPRLVFGGTDGVGSRFLVCALGIGFGGTEGVGSHLHIFSARTRFRRYRGRQMPF
jgi:hypothetical protein